MCKLARAIAVRRGFQINVDVGLLVANMLDVKLKPDTIKILTEYSNLTHPDQICEMKFKTETLPKTDALSGFKVRQVSGMVKYI